MTASVTCAILAAAFGPWVAALWATGESTEGGSSKELRLCVKAMFWLSVTAAVLLMLLDEIGA